MKIRLAAFVIAAAAPALAGEWISTDTGCRLWNENPIPGETVTWSGACTAGKVNGRGVEIWTYRRNDEVKTHRYEGHTSGGKRHGKGAMTYASGSRYEGDWVDDRAHGKGVYVLKNGIRYQGEFAVGKMRGRGVKSWPSGARYEGEFVDGNRHGFGLYIGAGGRRCEGRWRQDKMAGTGESWDKTAKRWLVCRLDGDVVKISE
jgi:hypothetical protein